MSGGSGRPGVVSRVVPHHVDHSDPRVRHCSVLMTERNGNGGTSTPRLCQYPGHRHQLPGSCLPVTSCALCLYCVICNNCMLQSQLRVTLCLFPTHEHFPVTLEGSHAWGCGPPAPYALCGGSSDRRPSVGFCFTVNVLGLGLFRGAPHTTSPSRRAVCSRLPRGLVIVLRGMRTRVVTLEAGSRRPARAQREASLLTSLFFPSRDTFSPRTCGLRPAP